MNKTWILIFVSSFVLGGCTLNIPGVFNSSTQDGSTPTTVPSSENLTTPGVTHVPTKGQGSITEMLNKGGSQKCDISFKDEMGTHTGVMYVSGKKFKQDITTKTTDQKETRSTIISDGQYVYIWNQDMGKSGIKMEITEAENGDYSTQNGKLDLEKKVDFECSTANLSDADLTPPKDIEFQDFSEQLKELQKSFGGLPTTTK